MFKFFIVTALALASTAAMADGFRCTSDDYRVKLFNQTQPENGTKNPAVLVVSKKGIGTVATLEADEIQVAYDAEEAVYQGTTNSKVDGRFMSVKLEVKKSALYKNDEGNVHLARLTLEANGGSDEVYLACQRYLKSENR